MSQVPTARQREAIESAMGPVLVLAGPGAGKTYCLIERIRYLVEERGLEPHRICAVTFTNRAAEEISQRLKHALGTRAEEVTRGTLHSLCMNILRAHPDLVGLKPGFGIADDTYQRLVLRRLDVWPLFRHGPLLLAFGKRRREGRSLPADDEKLFVRYCNFLRANNLVDFDDIITLAREALQENTGVAGAVRAQWDYVLVDEFQDLSRTQYDVLRFLSEQHHNIFGVGDDEQSIFAWTGADPKILSFFQKDFDIARPIVLDENRRCTSKIFNAARNLLRANPALFEKELRSLREGDFDVVALAFPTELEEGRWIVDDIRTDKPEHSLDWGDFAIVYRKHRTGGELERQLLAAGIPCRLARGRAMLDDQIVSYIIGSLRLMLFGDDPVEIEAFASRMLPPELLELIRASNGSPDGDFTQSMRDFALARRGEPDAKKVWRLIYHVENLRAIFRGHTSLGGVVEELLAQMRGTGRNRLEERIEDLTDPIAYPGAYELAQRIKRVQEEQGCIWLEPSHGIEVGLLGMLIESGIAVVCRTLGDASEVGETDLVLSADRTAAGSIGTLLFKALQVVASEGFDKGLADFVAFDLETTDRDVGECEIVEIAAVRVRAGEVVEKYHSLVRPDRPISEGARDVHGYTRESLELEPDFATAWPEFKEFVGDDVLVAHNGQQFDVPVLRRMVGDSEAFDGFTFYDTLPLARALFTSSARLESLAERFGIDKGRAHHADDDSVTLAEVVKHLNAHRLARSRKCALANVSDFLAISLALEDPYKINAEDGALLEVGRIHALGAYSDCLGFYELHAAGSTGSPGVSELIDRLGGESLRQRLRKKRTAAERYPASVARVTNLVTASTVESLQDSVTKMLEKAALSTSDGVEADPQRVNLLTLHATKGLEFSRVYIVGVEDTEMPGWREVKENKEVEIQEARRLLYVGMTRAEDRLILTRTDERFGNPSGGSRFLNEIGVGVKGVGC